MMAIFCVKARPQQCELEMPLNLKKLRLKSLKFFFVMARENSQLQSNSHVYWSHPV